MDKKFSLIKGLLPGNSYTKVPEAYFAEYRDEVTNFTRCRVGLLCALILAVYLLATTAGYFADPSVFNSRELPLGAFLVVAGLSVLWLNGRSKTLVAVKTNAYLFVAIALVFLTKLSIVYSDYFNVSAPLYMFALFAISFTIAWESREILVISLLHAAAFSYLFTVVRSVTPLAELAELAEDYFDGMILLSMSFILCYVLRRKENARQVENYLLLKEVRSRNEQMERELALATKVHKTLIPRSINTDRADVAVLYLPMFCMGGDYAKFQFIDNDRLFFIIFDVTGHGVSAALMVNRLHTEVERFMREGKSPEALLQGLNCLMLEQFQGINMFLSAFAGLLDFKNMKLIYSNHGHPAQYMYHIKGSSITRLPSQDTLLGISGLEQGPGERALDFAAGDKVLLFTDGIIETKGEKGEFYGEERLEHFVTNNHGLEVEDFNQSLLGELNAFKKGEFNDDIFILNIRTK
jgi:serine phosphatase RsbU (regulator of sigma subunit)